MQYAQETWRNPVHTTYACYNARIHTAYACLKIRAFWQRFFANNFADFHFSAGKIKISFSRWWRLELATFAIVLRVHASDISQPITSKSMQYAQETWRNPVHTTYACYNARIHTAYACLKNTRVSDRDFLQTTLLISTLVRVKIKISFSRWWRLELATFAIVLRVHASDISQPITSKSQRTTQFFSHTSTP